MDNSKPLLICVVGATAIGKTALSIKIAKALATEIISADSRQFYKEMTIGTAVPSSDELLAVPHHFIQNRSIFNDYSVGDFERDALLLLDQLFKKHHTIVLVGGSGLYVDAVVRGLDKFPKIDSNIREALNTRFKTYGLAALQEELKNVDPTYYNTVDINNHHRLIRALEIYRGTGKPYSSFLSKSASNRNFDVLYIGLTADREIIYDRINTRVISMVERGLVHEAKKLWPHQHLNALQTVGYRELFQYFEGKIDIETAVSEIQKNTRRFSKRQNTWFRKNTAIKWFDYQTGVDEILEYIKNKNAYDPDRL